jgi:hypothetical protein
MSEAQLYESGKRLLSLSSKIERATSEEEENRLCDERDLILKRLRDADAAYQKATHGDARGEASTPPSAHEEAARLRAALQEIRDLRMGRGDGAVGDYVEDVREIAIRALATPKDAGGDDSSLPKTAGPQVPIAPKADSHTPDLVAALSEIANHWACDYDHKHANTEAYRGPYGIGIVDGHRAAAIIARAALSKLEGK